MSYFCLACIVDCSFNTYFVFRDSGPDETRVKGYLPKDKQFLYTKNGKKLKSYNL